MIPIISVVGRTNSGKTTLVERLIPEFTKRGFRVGTIKHDTHDNFQMDHEGKDTWRHKKAGAAVVLISSATKLGMVASLYRSYILAGGKNSRMGQNKAFLKNKKTGSLETGSCPVRCVTSLFFKYQHGCRLSKICRGKMTVTETGSISYNILQRQKLANKLVDNYGRGITYLRLAVTDRCNLRCQYCMPAEGIQRLGHDDILSSEEMKFNGGQNSVTTTWTMNRILAEFKAAFPSMSRLIAPSSTAAIFTIPDFRGKIGLIGGYSRCFCGHCNRIRITPEGKLKICLYDNGALDLKYLIRNGFSRDEIKSLIIDCVKARFKNGHQAENKHFPGRSMAMIGG